MNLKLLILIASVFLLGVEVMAQNKITVAGKVTDEQGQGFPGANILVQGTSTGTTSDATGNFVVEAAEDANLVISFIGYKTQTVAVAGRSSIDISLIADAETLAEVVVVGYGTQKKSDVISSVAQVNPETMLKVPSSDVGEMLRGRAPGVFVTLSNAAPGGSSNIVIRGTRSLTGGSNPLVLADGVPVNSINDINPNDIASLEILKDAAAAAIYGSRASNGVILITTKRAKVGKTDVSYNGYYGVQTVKRYFDTYNGDEFANLKREAARTANGGVYLPDASVFTPIEQEVLQSRQFVDWSKELLRPSQYQSHNISFSTGTEKTTVYSSINYMNQQGIYPGTDLNRVTLRLNADQKISEWLKVGLNTNFQISGRNEPGTQQPLISSITASPLGKIYNDDGTYRLHPTGVTESFNPLLDLKEVTNKRKENISYINLFIDVTPWKGFKYRLNASRKSGVRNNESYSTSKSQAGVTSGGFGSGYIEFRDSTEYQLENIVDYKKSIDRHNLGFTFVQSVIETTGLYNQTAGGLFPNDLLGIYGLPSAGTIAPPKLRTDKRDLVSFVGRVQYDYSGKYYVNASFRTDGASVFGKNNKWANFPSVGIGWNVHTESFLQNNSIVSNLKLRATYGSVGNQGIAPYQSQSVATARDYVINGTTRISGYTPGSILPNPNLKWETSTTFNAGVDFGLWKNRVSGTVEFYDTRTHDLLVRATIPSSTGYQYQYQNVGEIQNKGIEVALNTVAYEKNDLVINVGVMFTKNINKILHLYGDKNGDGIEDNDIANNWFIGSPTTVQYRYKAIGIFQQGENIVSSPQPLAQPGDIKLLDKDKSGVIDDKDRVITPNGVPNWYGSIYSDIKYKGIDFSFNVVTVQGITRDNPYLYEYVKGGSLRAVLNGVKQNYWTPENPTGNWPRPNASNDPANITTLGMQDASYIRLQNLTLGYTLKEALTSKLHLTKFRIYVSAQNPLTITKFQAYTPDRSPQTQAQDQSGTGGANQYPEAISFIGGIQVKF